MIGSVLIEITENPPGVKYYDYELRDGDVYYVARRWILNCSQDIPPKNTLFHFGGKAMVVVDDRPGKSSIRAIDAKRFWRLRLFIAFALKRIKLIKSRIAMKVQRWKR